MPTPNWNSVEGKVLEGGYEIAQCLEAGPSSASFRVRILGDRFTNAYGEFYAPGEISPAQIALWVEACGLKHPNISTPLSAGEYDVDGERLAFIIRIRPDETLATVLQERALTPEEVRQVLNASVAALEFLHGHGFVQGTLSPRHIVAIGDSIQLSIDGIRRINTPLTADDEPTPAGDIRNLGATVYEIMTQQRCAEDCLDKAKTLPAPFNTIVERCLDPDPRNRSGLSDILAMLRGEQLPAAHLTEPALVEAGHKKVSEAPPPPAPAPTAARTATPETRVARRLRRMHDDEEKRPPRKNWIYAALAIIAAVAIIWAALPKRPQTSAQGPKTSSAWPSHEVEPMATRQNAATGGIPSRAAPAESAKGADTRRQTAQKPAKALGGAPATATVLRESLQDTRPTPTGKADVWRVVAYTYRQESGARKKADSINQNYPDLKAEAFSPGPGKPYLVVLGGAMTREEAARLREKARSDGMPRDTYIQNYNH
jgi:hypothetical protein